MSFYHLGIIVEDLEYAMSELGDALGLHWEPVRDRQRGDWQFRVAYCAEGPPYIELIEGRSQPGHPFDTTSGPRLDHIGYWTDDLERDSEKLALANLPIVVSGEHLGPDAGAVRGGAFTLHEAKSCGGRIQLTPRSSLARLQERLGTPPQSPAAR